MDVTPRPDLAGSLRFADRRRHPIRKIVIHRNTAGDGVDAIHAELVGVRGWRVFPYHFVVEDYRISQIHSLDVVAPHARGANSDGIGIALNVDGRKEAPSSAMWSRVVWLVGQLLKRYPDAVVHAHDVYAINGWDCPGRLVDVEKIETEARHAASRLEPNEIRAARTWQP